MSIGAMDAAEDDKYLFDCFIDTGDLSLLTDTKDSKCIVLGRTGSGKSALLEVIKNSEENTISLLPQELSLNYITNSTIIRFFENLGIKLDLFYQLLWRHVLVVELIKKKYNIANEESEKTFFERIRSIFDKDKNKEEAIDYFIEWGDKFWLETDKRIKELTTKLENELSATADMSGIGLPLSGTASDNLSREKIEEVIHRAQKVVNSVQIQKLNKVISLLAEDIFIDQQQKYFILIDKLDDEWVDDELRHRLIRALIETIKTFKKIIPVKIIVSLRTDLLSRVFEHTRDSGFQEEKYDDLILRLKWTRTELHELLDKRISQLIKSQYTSAGADFNGIFTGKPNREKPIDYILDRTLMRPRDAISFVNICLDRAYGEAEINTAIIKSAEKQYSKKRFNALCHEWYGTYPYLDRYTNIIKNKKTPFKHSDISDKDIDDLALNLSIIENPYPDPIRVIALKLFEKDSSSRAAIRINILRVLYRVGIVGVKKASYQSVSWSQEDEPLISESEIKNSTHFEIHPMLHSYLGANSH